MPRTVMQKHSLPRWPAQHSPDWVLELPGELAQDLRVVILRCALAGVSILDEEDEGQEVGRAQGAGTMAAERAGSCQRTRAPPAGNSGHGARRLRELEQDPCSQGIYEHVGWLHPS